MKKLNIYLLLVAFLSFIFFINCGKNKECDDETNPTCPNYNPCIEALPANADFIIFDSMEVAFPEVYGLAIELDKMWSPRDIHFRALHENDTYEWKIGADTRTFNEKEFFLSFNNISGNVEIRLITTKENLNDCFPTSLTRDTFYKNIYFYDLFLESDQIPIFGTYTGFDKDQPDSIYTIDIRFPDPISAGIYNLPKDCKERLSSAMNFKAFILSTGNIELCGNPRGVGILQEDNKTLIIEYNVGEVNGPRTHHKFIGIKN